MAYPSLLVTLLCYIAVSVALDPCANPFYLYDNGDRSPGCSPTHEPRADCNLREGWYKIVNLTGPLRMTSHAPRGAGCGTEHPIWMRDGHPEMDKGVVSRRVCVGSTHSSCRYSFTIKVKNCSSYFVYYLKKTRYNQRYCFDSNVTCSSVGNDTTSDDHKHHPMHVTYSSKFGCIMFLGGLLVGSLLVMTVVVVRARRYRLAGSKRALRRAPVVDTNLPPSYNECVGPAATVKY